MPKNFNCLNGMGANNKITFDVLRIGSLLILVAYFAPFLLIMGTYLWLSIQKSGFWHGSSIVMGVSLVVSTTLLTILMGAMKKQVHIFSGGVTVVDVFGRSRIWNISESDIKISACWSLAKGQYFGLEIDGPRDVIQLRFFKLKSDAIHEREQICELLQEQ